MIYIDLPWKCYVIFGYIWPIYGQKLKTSDLSIPTSTLPETNGDWETDGIAMIKTWSSSLMKLTSLSQFVNSCLLYLYIPLAFAVLMYPLAQRWQELSDFVLSEAEWNCMKLPFDRLWSKGLLQSPAGGLATR